MDAHEYLFFAAPFLSLVLLERDWKPAFLWGGRGWEGEVGRIGHGVITHSLQRERT